ncbi:MAG: TetR family transcriptional regulator [Bacteroidetes bacterium]|nr:TetR family transcriptional regulator [Bacteroidota bacterium]
MGRKKRIECAGAIYHVCSHAKEGTNLFQDDTDRHNFLQILGELCVRFQIGIFGYVLMPDHYHMLLKTVQPNLSKAMQWLGTSYTKKFNAWHNLTGRLFHGRFKSFLIADESYLFELSIYIHGNPLRHQITDNLEKYTWSSYPVYAGLAQPEKWLDAHTILSRFKKSKEHQAYQKAVVLNMEQTSHIWDNLKNGICYGSEKSAAKIIGAYNSRQNVAPLPHPSALELKIEDVCRHSMSILKLNYGNATIDPLKPNQTRDCRDLIVYYLYENCPFSITQISAQFKVTPSAISHRIKYIKKRIPKDRKYSQVYNRLRVKMNSLRQNESQITLYPSEENEKIQSLAPTQESNLKPDESKKPKKQGAKALKMKERLIQSTLYCLQNFGYHGTTISKIIEHAGVSKGAWQYHYKNKKELIVDAARYRYSLAINLSLEMNVIQKEQFSNKEEVLHELIEFMWENFYQGWHRDVWLEILVACRTDDELREELSPVVQDFFLSLSQIWHQHFTLEINAPGSIDALMNLLLYTLRGMATHSVVDGNSEYFKSLRKFLVESFVPLVNLA